MKRYRGILLPTIAVLVVTGICCAAGPNPLCVGNKALGGGQLNANTPGVSGGLGLNNIGLLVKTWGTVTYVDTDSKFFYIDDGSKLDDQSGIAEARGVRVSYAGLAQGNTFTAPDNGQFVVITGISSTTAITVGENTRIIPTLRPRRDTDMVRP
jgi:hypothetical protein